MYIDRAYGLSFQENAPVPTYEHRSVPGDEQWNVLRLVSSVFSFSFFFGRGEGGGGDCFDSRTFFIIFSLCNWKTNFIP